MFREGLGAVVRRDISASAETTERKKERKRKKKRDALWSSRRLRASHGFSIIWVPLFLLALIGFVTLAIDHGYVRVAKQQAQTAADAAALAAAPFVGDQVEAESIAIGMASENDIAGSSVILEPNPDNDAGGDIVFGDWDEEDRTFTPTTESPNAVKVVARRSFTHPNGMLSVFFARALGTSGVEFERTAIAICKGGGVGMVLLRTSGEALKHSGNGTISIEGAVYINSSDSKALSQSGDGTLTAASFEIVGDAYQSGGGDINGTINEGMDEFPDPLAHLPEPTLSSYVVRRTSKLSIGNTNLTLDPGRYQGGIDFSGSATVTLNPGVYIMEGGGFKFSTSSGRLIANGVMIYNTGTNNTTSNADQFLMSGNGPVNWTSPSDGVYAGIAYFQKRTLSDKKVQISGNGNISIDGAIYAKTAELQLSGNGDNLGAGIVAASAEISGDSSFGVAPLIGSGTKRSALVK